MRQQAAENENERKQVAWLEERIAQRDAKIDAIYVELWQEQAEKLQLIHDKHELELQLKEAEIKKCDAADAPTDSRQVIINKK
jgi:hypothetical protein|nr:MAG TPA: hypothetical protein [Caudoviricetes sp.]